MTGKTRSTKPVLAALLDGRFVGWVFESGDRKLMFEYESTWREDTSAYPISISLPLEAKRHGPRAVGAFLWGLLPDNPAVLEYWARKFSVSRYRVVHLLANVGEECAGAIQFALPDRVEDLLGSPAAKTAEPLSKKDLEVRIRDLRQNPAAGRTLRDTGQFSLAGSQSKTALYQSPTGSWGVPVGRMPTNRIIKPPTLGLENVAYNEFLCLGLAKRLGFSAPEATVLKAGNEVAISVHRYDRIEFDDVIIRVHQEDMCQALALMPSKKYEADGGPGVKRIADVLRQHSTDPDTDVQQFVIGVAFNWLIGGTDAHAKNYSILHAAGRQVRLAPLYDLISVVPYPELTHGRNRLAMAVDGETLIHAITWRHWKRLAASLALDGEQLVKHIKQVGERIPDALAETIAAAELDKKEIFVLRRIADIIIDHVTIRLETSEDA